MARASGASKQAVNAWLTDGHSTIEPKFAFALQDASGFSARWILLGEGPQKVAAIDRLPPSIRNPLIESINATVAFVGDTSSGS